MDGYIRDSHWLIVKHDFAQRASVSLPQAYLSKYDAMYAMEKFIEDFMKEHDGQHADTTPRNEAKLVYICKNSVSDPGAHNVTYKSLNDKGLQTRDIASWKAAPLTMEKTYIDERYQSRISTKWIPYGHYVTRNAQEHIAKYVIWLKQKAEPDGYFRSGADKYVQVISLELVEIPNNTYSNLLAEEIIESTYTGEDSTNHRKSLVNGLLLTPTFNTIEKRFSKEPKSVAEQLHTPASDQQRPGTPSLGQLKSLSKQFYTENVDTGSVLKINELRSANPNDFITWRCDGKSKGHWTPYVISKDDITFD